MRPKLLDVTETPADESELITTEELANMLRVDPSTVRRWRTSRPVQGPPFIPLSKGVIMYSLTDIRAWLSSRRIVPEAA